MAGDEFLPGDRLGPYTIEAVVGQGASAIVYRAQDPRFGEPVAIKVLAKHLASDVEAVERFSGEARALRAVDNDAVVSVYDIAQTPEAVPYMVLALADRGTLDDRLGLGRPATATELRTLLAFFERSLGALHERGLVHRDVKPSNVLLASSTGAEPTAQATFGLLRPDDRLLLGDLGLVKDTTAGRALTRGAGTHSYAAPEQRAVVSHVTTRSDLYAASAVIAEATIGRVRDANESWEDISAQIGQLGRPVFADALSAGFAEDPNERPVDIGDWATRLRSALASSDPELPKRQAGQALRSTNDGRSGFSLRNRSGKVAALLGLCVALIAASVLLFSSPTEDTSSVNTVRGPDVTVGPAATAAPPTGGETDNTSGSDETTPPPSVTPDRGAGGSGALETPDPTTTPTPDTAPSTSDNPSSDAVPSDDAPSDETLDDEVLSDQELSDEDTASEPTAPVAAATPAASPTASPTATDTRSGAGPAPTATEPTATVTATATATAAPSPTPSPSPTVTSIRDVDCATAGTTTVAGPAQGLTVIDTTASTATLSWSARDIPLSIFVGPQYLDNISVGANLYIAEGLEVGQDSIISIADHDTTVAELVGKASIVCAVSDAGVPGPPLVGPTMVTDLVVVEGSVTSTTATLQWTPAAGGGRYIMWTGELVPGQRFPRLNPVGAGGAAVGSTSFEFTDLPPGSEVVIGLRTIIDPNQSNLAWVTVNTLP